MQPTAHVHTFARQDADVCATRQPTKLPTCVTSSRSAAVTCEKQRWGGTAVEAAAAAAVASPPWQ